MKNIVVIFLIILTSYTLTSAQEVYDIVHPTTKVDIVIDNYSIQKILKVIPNISIVKNIDNINPYSQLLFIKYNEKTYRLDQINLLFLDHYLNDSVKLSADEIIKFYLVIDILTFCHDTIDNDLKIDFQISEINKKYSEPLDLSLKNIGFNNMQLNKKVELIWNYKYDSYKWTYEFNIGQNEIISCIKDYNKVCIGKSGYPIPNKIFKPFKFSSEMEKVNPTGLEYYINNFKKKKN